MVAVQLLRQQETALHLCLVNDGYPTGKGIAYSAASDVFLLNVHAGRMSAFPDQPHHFVDWLQRQPAFANVPAAELETSFMPRRQYGLYLEEILKETIQAASGFHKIEVLSTKANGCKATPDGQYALTLTNGQTLKAQQVVLATGNFLPAALRCQIPQEAVNSHFFPDPWVPQAWHGLTDQDTIALLGTGLTSIDIIMGLLETGFQGKIHAISSNGLLPRPYQTAESDSVFSQKVEKASSLPEVLNLFNQARRQHGKHSWERLVNGIRPHTQQLWRRFSLPDKKRFMRRFGSLWAVARHRLPPQVHQVVQEAITRGQLQITAGRLQAVSTGAQGLQLAIQSKTGLWELDVSRLVTCTGPQQNYQHLTDPLISSLKTQGLLQPHPLGIGVNATAHGQLLDRAGKPVPGLFTLGATMRGELWESNAVPELRQQAQALARELLFSGSFLETEPKTPQALSS